RPSIKGCVHTVTDSLLLARETWPGKSNSLDALCKRLEVDNSSRSLHGALLDAGLLAEVYVPMTRGPEPLVIDIVETHTAEEATLDAVDFRALTLRVVTATEEEQAAHLAVLADLDKASGGKTLWHAAMA